VDVRVRRARRSPMPPWAPGTLIEVAEIERYGAEVVGSRYATEGLQVLESTVPAGYFVYLPFAVRGRRAVMGRPVGRGSGQPVTDLRLKPGAGGVGVLWTWPLDCTQVEVVWRGPDEEADWTVTRDKYQEDNGFWLPLRVRQGMLHLTAISIVPLGEPARSEPVSLPLSGTEPAMVRWAMRRRCPLGSRRTVSLTAGTDLTDLTVLVRYSPGLVMPTVPTAGVPLYVRHGVSLAGNVPLRFSFVVPRQLRRGRPYWIRCFISGNGPLTLSDPPVTDMKVS
jgi:hypothetical protein